MVGFKHSASVRSIVHAGAAGKLAAMSRLCAALTLKPILEVQSVLPLNPGKQLGIKGCPHPSRMQLDESDTPQAFCGYLRQRPHNLAARRRQRTYGILGVVLRSCIAGLAASRHYLC